MKLVIVADGIQKASLSENRSESLLSSIDSSENFYFLDYMPNQETQKLFSEKGFKIIVLEDLIRQTAVSNPPLFSDIVQREEARIDENILSEFYKNQVVLITGGEGFIGSEIVDALLAMPVAQVLVYGHGENSASILCNKYIGDDRFTFILGDIRDEIKLESVIKNYKPYTVFHAAAYKHVPILDMYPEEAIKTNIIGTVNAINSASKYGVRNFVMISTDKAVDPISALGFSKRIAEKICLSMNAFIEDMNITTVRFGNVFGSIGSVVPIFLEQISLGQPLTMTDLKMSRYFMSIYEAVRLVLLAATTNKGHLFSFDMGDPISITFLAKKIVEHLGLLFDESKIEIIGNRGGEKNTEALIYSFEKILESSHEKLLVLQDITLPWTEEEISKICLELSDAAKYCSKDEILSLLNKYIL